MADSVKLDEEPHNLRQPKIDEHTTNSSFDQDMVKRSGAFSNLKRELTDEDLNSPGTQRLLLNELDKYDECQKKNEELQTKFYSSDKKNAVLTAELKSSRAFDIMYSFMLTVGSILIGLSPSINVNGQNYLTWWVFCIGVIAIFGAIVAKCFSINKVS